MKEEAPSPKQDPRKKGKQINRATQKRFLEALVQRKGNVTAACKIAEVQKSRVYEWRKKDPGFEKRYQATRKQLEEFLFERVCELGEMGDTTLLIFALKALNRGRFDDGFIKQKYAMDRGMQVSGGEAVLPLRVVLEREADPFTIPRPVVADGTLEEH